MNGRAVRFLDVSAVNAELRTELDDVLTRVLSSGCYVLGPEVEKFEHNFAEWCGAREGVGVGNGLDAVEIGLRALGVEPGDEVIVPSHTFVATWLAVCAAGAVPVPVEPRNAWSGLDPQAAAAAITHQTTAMVAVDMHGHPADVDSLASVARRHGLALLGDAAQAHGASRHGRPVGSLCDATAFSFYPAKNLGALGDGGALVTNDQNVAMRARRLRNYGGTNKYEHSIAGRNSRLDELQAAVLRVKLERLAEWNERRRKVADRYLNGLSSLASEGLVDLPEIAVGTVPSWHLFSLLVDHRDHVMSTLASAGIQTGIHYPAPPHRTGAFRHLDYGAGSFPVAEQICETTLSLPMGPHLSTGDVDYVISRLTSALTVG